MLKPTKNAKAWGRRLYVHFYGKTVSVAHIGDSRCYLLQDDDFVQVTEDHSLVNELVRTGEISREDAEHHPRKMC